MMLEIIDTHLLRSERDRQLAKSAIPHSRKNLRFRALRPQRSSPGDLKSRARELVYTLSVGLEFSERYFVTNSKKQPYRSQTLLSVSRNVKRLQVNAGDLGDVLCDADSRYFGTPSRSPTLSTTSSRTYTTSSSITRGSTPRPPPAPFPFQEPRIRVSSLLTTPSSRSRSYRLQVIQQPERGAEFGNTSLSRLPISPPVIVRLLIFDESGNSLRPDQELPFLIAHLSLWDEAGQSRIADSTRPRILYGNLVASIDQLEDTQGNPGLFFLFPDVSVRRRGTFRLRITLMRLPVPGGQISVGDPGAGGVLAEVQTSAFSVVPTSQYTSLPPTRISQAFARQGARLSGFTR